MHARRHQAQAARAQQRVGVRDLGRKQGIQALQRRLRLAELHLDHVQGELVVPGECTGDVLGGRRTSRLLEQPVGRGGDVEPVRVDQHVLELDAEPFEQAQHGLSGRSRRVRLRVGCGKPA